MPASGEQMNVEGGRRSKRWKLAMVVLLGVGVGVYVSTYVLLSTCGSYVSVASGQIRVPWGFATPDIYVWQPRFVVGYLFVSIGGETGWQANAVGLLYRPLLWLDQRYWHRTDYTVTEKWLQEARQRRSKAKRSAEAPDRW